MKLQSIRGMNDIFELEARLWGKIESISRKVFAAHGYTEIRTPIVENTQLFQRSVGESSDIVAKEMYSFSDRNGDSLSLRPEGTASVVRAYLQHSLMQDKAVQKFFYLGPMFRHERPQKGRYRQFYQLGVEVFGAAEALADVEVIQIQDALLKAFGIEERELHISSLGCSVCRPPYNAKLKQELDKISDKICEDCLRRKEKNPLRVFDCKNPNCQELYKGLPKMMDAICGDCQEHFADLKKGLDALGIRYKIDTSLVRGLDYYNRSAFEFVSTGEVLGAQATLSAGGRYDTLVENLGGKPTPAVGFAAGIERLALLMQEQKDSLQLRPDIYFVLPDDSAWEIALPLAAILREHGHYIETDLQKKKMKQQMKRANKLAARFVLILGESERESAKAILKNMEDGQQREISLDSLEQDLLNLLSN
mgnify:CR=1 FL=1